MATVLSPVADVCRAAKRAASVLAQTDTAVKDGALEAIATGLEARMQEVLESNERDMQAGREADIGAALLDRLRLDEARVRAIAQAVRQIAALADPVGEVIDGWRLPNGLDVRKVRVPLGVVAVVYEARPNVAIDATALCLKSGNAIVLRGSSSASHSNAALYRVAYEGAVQAGLPEGCVSLLAGGGREELAELATQGASVDLIIPRGGERLKEALQAVATVPVIYAASGNCHVYVDAAADLEKAEAIVLNAKTQRPGVCNAAETFLVHRTVADAFVPRALEAMAANGVDVFGDEAVRALDRTGRVEPPIGEARYDAAGIQSMRTFLAVARSRYASQYAAGEVRSRKVPFGQFKKETAGYLRRLFRRAGQGKTTQIIAISASCPELARQLRGLESGPDGVWKKAEDQHGPDSLVAGAQRIARIHRQLQQEE